ncbi:hypothetical protein [Chryseobacterium pennipullorum]|uniref:Uncharacterized protein n=1 Tax=Chryseobacterium pennipullorum TaxID=2258963 RepID=A0A3D9B990_9FLAO|nr:hypothetical protein [Chryseobacterium pennipullorum]REC50235.1 hypothetical protein DRF67_01515 [Chryseobacterium pennipullorum]
MNYVSLTYLANLFLYSLYFLSRNGAETDASPLAYTISGVLSLFLIGAGYWNAKNKMTYRSVLWMFFVNILLFIMSGVFDRFGEDFNILSTAGDESFIFTLVLVAYNGYLYPMIIDLDGSGFPLVLPVILSGVLPSLGYLAGAGYFSKNRISGNNDQLLKK